MQQQARPKRVSTPWLLLPLAALAAVSPLIVHGVSCGQDLGFHIVSWLDAAQQLRHGHYPHWAVTPAWNAGEPRFLFYPPLSWLLGAGLTMVLPVSATPTVFIFLVLVAAALSMYRLARRFAPQDAALLAAAFYIGNPYMLFNAYERSALAELMAAAWIPLLLLALLRERPRVREIAVPLALLWLTNAPAAVMGSYMLALVATLRIARGFYMPRQHKPVPLRDPLCLALNFIAGAALGLALPAFYLVPAAYERRYVQVAMAIIPNMRFQDNFLFDRTADAAHNAVNHTASVLALTLLALTTLSIGLLALRSPAPTPTGRTTPTPLLPLAVLTVAVAVLLVPVSTPLWEHLPELAFLQFPWRLLSLLSVVLALSVAALLATVRVPHRATLLAPLLALALSAGAYALYAQACEPGDNPKTWQTSLETHHGVPPTDEYTPTNADNDILRTSNRGFWFADNPNAPAPDTQPTAAELNPAIGGDDTPVPPEQSLSTPAPHRFHFHADRPGYLILNLREYPSWSVNAADANSPGRCEPPVVARDDGLIAIQLFYASDFDIEVEWRYTADMQIGVAISVLALLGLLLSAWRACRLPSPAHRPLA